MSHQNTAAQATSTQTGMTYRDSFAAAAMVRLLDGNSTIDAEGAQSIAVRSYLLADAMVAVRNEPQPQPAAPAPEQETPAPAPAAQEAQPQVPQPDPFTQQYEWSADIEDLLKKAEKPGQVSALYAANKQLIDNEPGLKEWLDSQLEEMRSKLPAISTNQFNELAASLAKGDVQAGFTARDLYSVNKEQKNALNDAFKSYQRHAKNAKRKYDKEDDLGAAIELCPTPGLLDTIHAGNALMIDRSPRLKAAFDRRKEVLTTPAG